MLATMALAGQSPTGALAGTPMPVDTYISRDSTVMPPDTYDRWVFKVSVWGMVPTRILGEGMAGGI